MSEAAVKKYFEVWNNHDVPGLLELFAPDVTLRDWDVEKSGAKDVGEANGAIFEGVPNIKIEVLTIHMAGLTAAAEILVKLNDEGNTVLKVCDVIDFTEDGKIKAVRAYKG